MRKIVLLAVLAFFTVSVVYAAPFVPTPMRISAPKTIKYDFDGKPLEVNYTVSGSPGGVFFAVFTKDKGKSIGKVTNGYLGWHFVNNIDTSVYISSKLEMTLGSNKITWDGKDSDKKIVPAGEYTYYMWAYDDRNQKQIASKYLKTIMHNLAKQVHIQERGTDGKPLTNPFMLYTPYINSSHRAKWTIGNEPTDSTLVETCDIRVATTGLSYDRAPIPVPGDFNQIFLSGGITPATGKGIRVWKMKWVPNGVNQLDLKWGKNGAFEWDRGNSPYSGPETDGKYLYTVNNKYNTQTPVEAEFAVIDLTDGALVNTVDLSDWWCNMEEAARGAFPCGGPNGLTERNGNIFLGSHGSCNVQMVNPTAESKNDFVMWWNKNGDYVMDHHFMPDSATKWVCNDFKVPPFSTSFQVDDNLWMAGATYGLGAVSFGLIAPDGTGLGYFAYAGDSDSRKFFVNFVDNGSTYDGMYTDNNASVSLANNLNGATVQPGLMYSPHDSVKGVIANQIGVADDAPSLFKVNQNAPNPFNPATSISFSISAPGTVKAEVFSMAGQKVATLLDASMKAGNHTVTWNAERFSAGIYFCTITAGNMSKTVKMTLLK